MVFFKLSQDLRELSRKLPDSSEPALNTTAFPALRRVLSCLVWLGFYDLSPALQVAFDGSGQHMWQNQPSDPGLQ